MTSRPAHVLAAALLLSACEKPPTPEMFAERDRFVLKMHIRVESLVCDATYPNFGPPWECDGVTESGAPSKFWCWRDGCRWVLR